MDDQAILSALREGKEQQALHSLYQEVFPKVRKLVQGGMDDAEEAEDVFQDALMIFYKQVKMGKFDEKYEVAGFIYTIAKNQWINRQKRKSRGVVTEEKDLPQLLTSNRLDDMMVGERNQLIRDIFNQLDERCKELLTYTILQNLAMEDIILRMGFSTEGAASVANFRCKKKLADMVKGNIEMQKHWKG